MSLATAARINGLEIGLIKRPTRVFRCQVSSNSVFVTEHQAPPNTAIGNEKMEDKLANFREHQKNAARLSFAEEAKTLVHLGRYGVISTISRDPGLSGFPFGSVVGYAPDEDSLPVFALSSLSAHTQDLREDNKASLSVTAASFKGAADARVTITGLVIPVEGEDEKASCREAYLAAHPSAFWIDFGDFSFFKMSKADFKSARLVGGFARAGNIDCKQYLSASVDPVSQFSGPVSSHMNSDHMDALIACIEHFAGLTVEKANLLSVDRLGMNIEVEYQGSRFKLRLPFLTEAKTRKEVKDSIVELTRAASKPSQ